MVRVGVLPSCPNRLHNLTSLVLYMTCFQTWPPGASSNRWSCFAGHFAPQVCILWKNTIPTQMEPKNLASPRVAKRRRRLMNSLGLHSIQTDPPPPNLAFMPSTAFLIFFAIISEHFYFSVLGSTFTSNFSPLVSRPGSRLRHAHKPGGTPTRMLVVQCRLQGSGPTIGLFHEHLRSTVIQVLLT